MSEEVDPFGLSLIESSSSSKRDTTDKPSATFEVAPEVPHEAMNLVVAVPSSASKQVYENLTYEEMIKPVQGPVNLFSKPMDDIKNTRLGYVENHRMETFSFEDQRRTFMNYGYAYDPGKQFTQPGAIIGDKKRAAEYQNTTVGENITVKEKKRRQAFGDPSIADGYLGPWAGYEGESQNADEKVLISLEEEERIKKQVEEKISSITKNQEVETYEETQFHAVKEKDYLGRTFIDPPGDTDYDLLKDPSSHECFLPKKLIHTYVGHSRGVNAIRFFPNSGHLLLSASADSKIKIWDVFHERLCVRTYIGHSKSVKDVQFNFDGKNFISSGYDKYIKLWDTESGKCLLRMKHDKMANCVTYNPLEPNIVMTGMIDAKILQSDLRTGEVVQTYDQHLGPVNCITFIDDNNTFVSTSEDKSLRLWKYGVPTTIKCISDPSLHSMPCSATHPTSDWVAFQSLSNQVLVYSSEENFRLHKTKRFSGHTTAGYACSIDFSPDGKYLLSGDSGGNYVVWDWKTCKLLKKQRVHTQVTIGVAWNPQLPSTIATCSWDSRVLLFE